LVLAIALVSHCRCAMTRFALGLLRDPTKTLVL